MNVAAKLDELVRRVPGVAGYLDRETARTADKALREHLAGELGRLRRVIDGIVRVHAERRAFALLPLLDRLGSKLDKLANMIRFAAQGYRPIFDHEQADGAQLQRLYAYDRELAGQIDTIRAHVDALRASEDDAALQRDGAVLDNLFDAFEDVVQRRQDVLGSAD